MVPHWGYEATFSTWLLWLFLSSGVCLGEEIKGSMYSSFLCESNGNKVFWLSEKTNAIITGKSDDSVRKHCKIVFGLASNNGNARLMVNFDAVYFHDCGVRLQINQSASSKFDRPNINKEIYMSGCYSGNPGPLYAQPRNYVLLSLTKKDVGLQAYNFRLNISVAEKLPTTGPPLHTVIIVSFVCAVAVITAAVLLLKYVVRISYRWSEERREQAMTRAINIYNSCEPSEEPEMMYIRPGGGSASSSSHSGSAGQGSGRGKQGGAEIAFVHSDGRIERFRPLAHQRQEPTSSPATLQRPNPQKCRVKTSPSAGPRQPPRAKNVTGDTSDEPVHFLVRYSQRHNESQSLVDLSETASVGGTVLPPSYEEALDMPQPERGQTTQSADNLSGAVAAVSQHDNRANFSDPPCPAIQTDGTLEGTVSSGRYGKDSSKRPSEDLEDLGPDSANYVNIGGRLEILDAAEEEEDASQEGSSQQPLLHSPN